MKIERKNIFFQRMARYLLFKKLNIHAEITSQRRRGLHSPNKNETREWLHGQRNEGTQ